MSSPAVARLRQAATIRERCANITQAVAEGRSAHFTLARARLADAADRVAQVTRANYPTLRIPYHSRWRHFEAGGMDRKTELDLQLAGLDAAAQARARIDLTVVSVLLDAGAGAAWHYVEPSSGRRFERSEGLGVASFRGFLQGLFSSDPAQPLRADAAALQRMDVSTLATMFQVRPDNPLVGLEGRAQLLRRLGDALALQHGSFGHDGRPGALHDRLALKPVTAARLLQSLLDTLSGIWLADNELDGQPLGDCWRHPFAGGSGADAGWVPFHKLSQWLCYSLLEPFEWSGTPVTELDALTGLPEYRNGGLLLDTGVIVPRDPGFTQRRHTTGDEAIVEWRALTVSLLDELAPLVRERLGRGEAELPLARILEGGTWAAGRALARERRDGRPPLVIESDGTVF